MIWLVRHGLARGNERGLYLGQSDPPLTAEGRRQVAQLARRLAAVPLSAVVSSDLRRALQTAAAIAEPRGLDVRADPRLREADFGLWTGLTWEEIARRWPTVWHSWVADPETVAPPGGETLAEVRRRAEAALAGTGPRFVVVTHGGVIRALVPGSRPAPASAFRLPPIR